jgi:hypothetical protein
MGVRKPCLRFLKRQHGCRTPYVYPESLSLTGILGFRMKTCQPSWNWEFGRPPVLYHFIVSSTCRHVLVPDFVAFSMRM